MQAWTVPVSLNRGSCSHGFRLGQRDILTAVDAALASRMQPVVNVALGASLSTVILTVPMMEVLALF